MKTIHITLAESDGGDGIGRHDDTPESTFDASQFAIGIEVEKEHSDNLEFIESIVRDHLSEDPEYYTKLIKMEKESEMSKVIKVEDMPNPLYTKHKAVATSVSKEVETSAWSNNVDGICPKCGLQMESASLGMAMGNQKVHYCNNCRVAEPCKN